MKIFGKKYSKKTQSFLYKYITLKHPQKGVKKFVYVIFFSEI